MKWSKGVWVTTIMCYLIFFTIIGVEIYRGYVCLGNCSIAFSHFSAAFLFILIPVYLTLITPQNVVIEGHMLIVKRLIKPVKIDLSQVVFCQRVLKKDLKHATRLWGSGGFAGFWGWFKDPQFGKFRMFTGDMKNMYKLVMKDGKRYVISYLPKEESDQNALNDLCNKEG